MSAVLRVLGTDLDVDEAIRTTGIEPCAVHRRGQRRFPHSTSNESVFSENAIYVLLSDAEFTDFSMQVEEAIQFLKDYASAIQSLVDSHGVDEAYIDFGVRRRDVVAQADVFPGSLVRTAGQFGLGLGFTQYEIADDK